MTDALRAGAGRAAHAASARERGRRGLLVLGAAFLLAGCGSSQPPQLPDRPVSAPSGVASSDLILELLQEREDQAMRLAQLEQRMSELENNLAVAPSPPPSPAPLPEGAPAPQTAQPWLSPPAPPSPLFEPVPVVSGAEPAETAKPAAPSASAPPRRNASPRIPAEYQRALSLLLDQEKPEAARAAFSIFLTDNPDHPLTPNVIYWVGETYYAEKQYEDAILLFKDVAARFAQHDKAPDALYKAALAYRRLGDGANAQYLEQLLLSDYPESRAAGLLRSASR